MYDIWFEPFQFQKQFRPGHGKLVFRVGPVSHGTELDNVLSPFQFFGLWAEYQYFVPAVFKFLLEQVY